MAKSKPDKPCKCIEQVNKQLEQSNARISQGLQINFKTGASGLSSPFVVVEKVDGKIRKRLPSVVCSFCPFCGSKYPE
jgi:hypothetical protein